MVFEVAALENRHIREIVAVHIGAFPDFFLTFLGSGFLEEFYKSFLYDDQGIGFVAMDTETNEILGAIVGPLSPKGYFKRLLKRRWYAFCLASLVAVIKKPSVVKKLFRAVFYRGQAPQGKDRALLSSISVSPDAQGKGVGKALALRWLEEVKGRGGKGAFLTTDTENNDAINSFYQKLGWKLESIYTTSKGREMNRYTYDFEG